MKITRVIFRFCPILLVVFLLTMPGVTMAQIDPESEPDSGLNEREESTPEQYPVLNGHRFFPTILIGSPFVQSTISSAIGGGRVGDLNYTITNPVNDSTLSLRGDLGFLLVLLEFQHALDEFVALQFKTIIIERIAAHEESILSQGLTGEVGFELGIRVKIWETDRVYVALSGAYASSTLVGVTPLDFLEDVLDGGLESIGSNSLVRSENTDLFVFGSDVAFAPAPYLGIIGHLRVGSADTPQDGDNNVPIASLGFSAHLDFGSLINTPIGVTLGILTNSFSLGIDDLATRNTSLVYGLSYTGWKNYDFGLEVTSSRLRQIDEETIFTGQLARIRMSFYY